MKAKIIAWTLRRIFGRLTCTHSCSNRVEWTYEKTFAGRLFEYRVIRRQTDIPDTYSREERYAMAKILREEQQRDGWDVWSCFDSPTSVR